MYALPSSDSVKSHGGGCCLVLHTTFSEGIFYHALPSSFSLRAMQAGAVFVFHTRHNFFLYSLLPKIFLYRKRIGVIRIYLKERIEQLVGQRRQKNGKRDAPASERSEQHNFVFFVNFIHTDGKEEA